MVDRWEFSLTVLVMKVASCTAEQMVSVVKTCCKWECVVPVQINY